MTIQVFSLDFDGCLSNRRFCHDEKMDVFRNNKKLFIKLDDYISETTKTILMIGSSRQSIYLDYLSQRNNRMFIRCFPFYSQIARALKINFDPFLLSDLYFNIIPGMTYHRSMHIDYPFKQRADYESHSFLIPEFYKGIKAFRKDCIQDESKFCLIYAQLHKVAQDYPNQKIIFRFFDDRLELLNDLREVFLTNLDLIPHQIEFECHLYQGDEPRLHFSMSGRGIIDLDYRNTIDQILQTVCERADHYINVSKQYDFTHMPQRLAFQVSNNEEYKKVQHYQHLYAQLLILEHKSEELLVRKHMPAYSVATDLYKKLNQQLFSFYERQLTPHLFRDNCHQLIANARQELEKHRGWKEFLVNLFAAIIMCCGVGYLISVGIRRDWTLFKFPTDSAKKLDQLDKEIDSFVTHL